MKNYYDLYQLGRLIKRLYFEGAGLYFKNKQNIKVDERELLQDSEIINNKAYELSMKLGFEHLKIYWDQIFNLINNNTVSQKDFLYKINNLYKQLDIAIEESLKSEEKEFYKLGVLLSNSWLYMVASKKFNDLKNNLSSFSITVNTKLSKYNKLTEIIEKIDKCIHSADIETFNIIIEQLIDEIKIIDQKRKEKMDKSGKKINIKVDGKNHNVQIGDYNTQNNIKIALKELKEKIEQADGSQKEKEEAKLRLQNLLEHPLVSAIVGGSIGSIL